MPPRTPHRLPPEPPPTIMEALRKRVAGQDLSLLGALFSLRMAAQQADNAITDWMADTAGSPARFQILALLWASGTTGVPHKEIVKALQVTRATVSELMAALERDGLVKSVVDQEDRRNLIASLTSRGRAIFEKSIDSNLASLRGAFATLSEDEQGTLMSLLQRLQLGFASVRDR
ncbi:MAG TPA: MarR family transcriptional regulator [Acetobacteraceae bacterium]|nr:MarR family transcriptional regulator [Acetobacteraceae bacterium]